MASLFTRIIDGEIPGRFVWKDDQCVGFLTIAPLGPGHTLVVPRLEIEQWTDVEPDLLAHLVAVARSIGRAQQEQWEAPRIGLLAQGFEVAHVHLHVWPAFSPADFDLRRAESDPDPARMDADASSLRERLRAQGHGDAVPRD